METPVEETDKTPTPPSTVISSNVKKPQYLFFFVIALVLILLIGTGTFFFFTDSQSTCPEVAGQTLSPEEETVASEVPIMRTISNQNIATSTQQLISVKGLSFNIPSQALATIGSSSVTARVDFGNKAVNVFPSDDVNGMTGLDSVFATSKCLDPKFLKWKGNDSDYEEEHNLLYLTPNSGRNLPHDLLLALLFSKDLIAKDTPIYEASTSNWYFFQMYNPDAIVAVDVFDSTGKEKNKLLFKNMSQQEIDAVLSSLKSQ